MKIVAQLSAFLFLVNCCGIQGVNEKDNHVTEKRDRVWRFGLLIYCVTAHNPYDYLNYGCYCGSGGSGEFKDEIDRCCKIHDQCYDKLATEPPEGKGVCSRLGLHSTGYDYQCTEKNGTGVATCSSENDDCASGICECDAEAATCFKGKEYNIELKNIDRETLCADDDDEDEEKSKKEKKEE